MASIYDLKPAFQGLLRPLVSRLAASGVTANQVTVAAMMMSVVVGLAILAAPDHSAMLLLLPLVLFVRMALNAVDGMLAREFGQQSKLGAILNELGDVLSDAALYLPLAWVPFVWVPLIEGIVVLAVISEMTGVVAVQIGAKRQYQGPMGKSDRAFVFGALGLALGLGVPAGLWLTALQLLVLALLGYTIINRARRGLAEVS